MLFFSIILFSFSVIYNIFLLGSIKERENEMKRIKNLNSSFSENITILGNKLEELKKLYSLEKIMEDKNSKEFWGLLNGIELKGSDIGAVVLFGSRSGARMNRGKGDRLVKVKCNFKLYEK